MRSIARVVLARIDVRIEGLEHVPARGPALLVCRHYHHLYDGAVLTLALARPVRILVALDWTRNAVQRRMMETLCGVARWPTVLRPRDPANVWGAAYDPRERSRCARQALVRGAELLRRGELLAIFPEGFPTVDPVARRKREDEWLPFASGYLSIAERARRAGVPVPLVPAGFSYAGPAERPARITLRFGAPHLIGAPSERRHVASELESRVRALSA
jgi:1-acyl-sn-glycerol-3-phosphate acyltransferase